MEHGENVSKNLFLKSAEKPFVKLQSSNSLKLVFSYLLKRIKIKITAEFHVSRRHIMSPEMRPKRLGTFEKRAPKSLTETCCFVINYKFILGFWLCKLFEFFCLSLQ